MLKLIAIINYLAAGTAEGAAVGATVGTAVGATVGTAVGVAVASAVVTAEALLLSLEESQPSKDKATKNKLTLFI